MFKKDKLSLKVGGFNMENKDSEHKDQNEKIKDHHAGSMSNVGNHKHKEDKYSKFMVPLIAVAALLIVFNQVQISGITGGIGGGITGSAISILNLKGGGDLANVDVTQIQSTAQGIAVLFPVDEIKTTQDAIDIMIPTGTPEYGNAMGVSFDKPIESMELLSRSYNALMQQIKSENPEVWQRYLNLATQPRGIACEFCCGVGASGIDKNGRITCGCQHNPAIQTITLWLMLNTDYSDAEILKEVYRWKALWFPKNMVGLASQIAGGDSSVLEDLPGMVGGC